MKKLNKLFISNVVALIVIVTLFVTSTAYGMDLSSNSYLRKPLLFNDSVSGSEQKRPGEVVSRLFNSEDDVGINPQAKFPRPSKSLLNYITSWSSRLTLGFVALWFISFLYTTLSSLLAGIRMMDIVRDEIIPISVLVIMATGVSLAAKEIFERRDLRNISRSVFITLFLAGSIYFTNYIYKPYYYPTPDLEIPVATTLFSMRGPIILDIDRLLPFHGLMVGKSASKTGGLLSCRILFMTDRDRSCMFQDAEKVIKYIRKSEPDTPIVINLSIGLGIYADEEVAAIRRLRQQGVLIFVAAGNDNATIGDHDSYPENYPGVFIVSAVEGLKKSPDSNYDPKVAFSASARYTSFASPQVAGLSAKIQRKLQQLYPDMSLQDLANKSLEIMRDTALPLSDDRYWLEGLLGAGLIDPARAMKKVHQQSLGRNDGSGLSLPSDSLPTEKILNPVKGYGETKDLIPKSFIMFSIGSRAIKTSQ